MLRDNGRLPARKNIAILKAKRSQYSPRHPAMSAERKRPVRQTVNLSVERAEI